MTQHQSAWLVILALFACCGPLQAQVDYHGTDSPWNNRADSGPDAEVPGWFYNLGLTGLRAQLIAEEPKALLIKYVFPNSPASDQIQIGDWIVGAGGEKFKADHQDGYGERVFGARGPISELADVLERCQGVDGKISLMVRRDGEEQTVVLDVGQLYGSYSATFPESCPKSALILSELLEYIAEQQGEDGSFGDAVNNTFAPLALLASGEARYLPAIERNVKYHASETRPNDKRNGTLLNWTYTSAGIVMSEYYLATKAEWVLPELREVYEHLRTAQYMEMSQLNPKAKLSHPHSFPKGPDNAHGGWGHNPGFEGYGPIAMLTGQGALAYSLMSRCGIEIDGKRHAAAYEFLRKGTGENGYLWYADEIGGGPDNWADMGRTGASAVANYLAPGQDPSAQKRALAHIQVIGQHPQSFPDTHGSPVMGMGYTALAANLDPACFRKLMDANRWWFTMAQCHDQTFYYQPNRDNAGYGSDSRLTASCAVALIFSMPKRNLVITGREES